MSVKENDSFITLSQFMKIWTSWIVVVVTRLFTVWYEVSGWCLFVFTDQEPTVVLGILCVGCQEHREQIIADPSTITLIFYLISLQRYVCLPSQMLRKTADVSRDNYWQISELSAADWKWGSPSKLELRNRAFWRRICDPQTESWHLPQPRH